MSRTYRNVRIISHGGMDTVGGNYYYGGTVFTQNQINLLKNPPARPSVYDPMYEKQWYEYERVVASMQFEGDDYQWEKISKLRSYKGFEFNDTRVRHEWRIDPETNEYDYFRYFSLERVEIIRKWRWVKTNPNHYFWRCDGLEWDEDYDDWLDIHKHVYRNRSVHRQRINGIRRTKKINSRNRRRREERDTAMRLGEWYDETY